MARKRRATSVPAPADEPAAADAPAGVDEFLRDNGLPGGIRAGTSLPAHVVYFLLRERLARGRVRLLAHRDADEIAAPVAAVAVEDGRLAVSVREDGVSRLLPRSFRELLDPEKNPKTGRSLAAFLGVFDNAVLHDYFRARTLHLSAGESGSVAERFAFDLLGLDHREWPAPEDRAAWQALVPDVLGDSEPLSVLGKAIGLFFPALGAGKVCVRKGEGVAEALPDAARVAVGDPERGVGRGRLGSSVRSAEHVVVRLGPLPFDQYWAFLPGRAAAPGVPLVAVAAPRPHPSEVAGAGDSGRDQPRLAAVFRALLPVTARVTVELELAASARTAKLGHGGLGRTMVLGENGR
jgi:hypothetical protein